MKFMNIQKTTLLDTLLGSGFDDGMVLEMNLECVMEARMTVPQEFPCSVDIDSMQFRAR